MKYNYHRDERGVCFWLRVSTNGIGFVFKNTPLIFSERMHLKDKFIRLPFGFRLGFLSRFILPCH